MYKNFLEIHGLALEICNLFSIIIYYKNTTDISSYDNINKYNLYYHRVQNMYKNPYKNMPYILFRNVRSRRTRSNINTK